MKRTHAMLSSKDAVFWVIDFKRAVGTDRTGRRVGIFSADQTSLAPDLQQQQVGKASKLNFLSFTLSFPFLSFRNSITYSLLKNQIKTSLAGLNGTRFSKQEFRFIQHLPYNSNGKRLLKIVSIIYSNLSIFSVN